MCLLVLNQEFLNQLKKQWLWLKHLQQRDQHPQRIKINKETTTKTAAEAVENKAIELDKDSEELLINEVRKKTMTTDPLRQ